MVVRIGLVVLDDKVMAVVVALGLELPRAQRVDTGHLELDLGGARRGVRAHETNRSCQEAVRAERCEHLQGVLPQCSTGITRAVARETDAEGDIHVRGGRAAKCDAGSRLPATSARAHVPVRAAGDVERRRGVVVRDERRVLAAERRAHKPPSLRRVIVEVVAR